MRGESFAPMPLRDSSPTKAVRVLPKEALHIFLSDWGNFLQGIDSKGPLLTRPGRDIVFVTDPESVFCCIQAEDFGVRLGLGYSTGEGCGVIFLDTTTLDDNVPLPAPEAARAGLTTGGAREWIIDGNPHIDLDQSKMEVFEVSESNHRSGPLR